MAHKPDYIKMLPPIPRNRWSYRMARMPFNVTADGMLICNNCEASFYRVIGEMFKHCPECGVKIGGKDHA